MKKSKKLFMAVLLSVAVLAQSVTGMLSAVAAEGKLTITESFLEETYVCYIGTEVFAGNGFKVGYDGPEDAVIEVRPIDFPEGLTLDKNEAGEYVIAGTPVGEPTWKAEEYRFEVSAETEQGKDTEQFRVSIATRDWEKEYKIAEPLYAERIAVSKEVANTETAVEEFLNQNMKIPGLAEYFDESLNIKVDIMTNELRPFVPADSEDSEFYYSIAVENENGDSYFEIGDLEGFVTADETEITADKTEAVVSVPASIMCETAVATFDKDAIKAVFAQAEAADSQVIMLEVKTPENRYVAETVAHVNGTFFEAKSYNGTTMAIDTSIASYVLTPESFSGTIDKLDLINLSSIILPMVEIDITAKRTDSTISQTASYAGNVFYHTKVELEKGRLHSNAKLQEQHFEPDISQLKRALQANNIVENNEIRNPEADAGVAIGGRTPIGVTEDSEYYYIAAADVSLTYDASKIEVAEDTQIEQTPTFNEFELGTVFERGDAEYLVTDVTDNSATAMEIDGYSTITFTEGEDEDGAPEEDISYNNIAVFRPKMVVDINSNYYNVAYKVADADDTAYFIEPEDGKVIKIEDLLGDPKFYATDAPVENIFAAENRNAVPVIDDDYTGELTFEVPFMGSTAMNKGYEIETFFGAHFSEEAENDENEVEITFDKVTGNAKVDFALNSFSPFLAFAKVGKAEEVKPSSSSSGGGGLQAGGDTSRTGADEYDTDKGNSGIADQNPPSVSEIKLPFTDVSTGDWFYENVKYVYENGLMNGTSATLFAPNTNITRAMMVTVLWRMENEPVVNYLMTFEDVEAEKWYTEAVRWAASEGIVNGYSETQFAPNNNITREQIAAIMHRYAKFKGYDVSVGENTNILSYDDFADISEYAIAPMQYAAGAGLMKGKSESTLNPKDFATRAEIAAILNRFIEANK